MDSAQTRVAKRGWSLGPVPARALLAGVGRFCRRKPLGAVGGALVGLLLLTALLADVIATHDPYVYDFESQLAGPSTAHYFGTDVNGRDVFTRVVFGARISVIVGFGAVVIGTTLAVTIGLVTGYFGGMVDRLGQRIVDAMMAFPYLVLLLTLVSLLGAGILQLVVALGVLTSFGASRVHRSAVLAIKNQDYVEAARALGAAPTRVILSHILPSIFAPIMVTATVALGGVILAEASLSFLGFGVPPPQPSWGSMLSVDGRSYLVTAPWLAIFPGLALSAAVFGFNMLGDALRDVLDPRLRGAQ